MNNLNIFADATINGGNYDHIKIFGSTTVNGELNALTMKVFGSGDFNAYCDIKEIEIFGSCTFQRLIKANSLNIKGSCTYNDDVNVEMLKVFGSVDFNKKLSKAKEIKIYGSVSSSVIEANKIVIEGSINCREQLNSDDIEIKTNDECQIKEMVGSKIVVKCKKHLFQRQKGIIYADIIEGDDLDLEHVVAKVVRGNKIKIGPHCKIDKVEYSDSLTVSDQSQVGEQEKVN